MLQTQLTSTIMVLIWSIHSLRDCSSIRDSMNCAAQVKYTKAVKLTSSYILMCARLVYNVNACSLRVFKTHLLSRPYSLQLSVVLWVCYVHVQFSAVCHAASQIVYLKQKVQ